MDKLEKEAFELKEMIQLRLSEKDYKLLVTCIIKLKSNIESLQQQALKVKDVEKRAKYDNIRMQAEQFVQNVITGIQEDLTELFAFAYELRK